MPAHLNIDDPKRFAIQTFFNAVSDLNFVDVIRRLFQGIGQTINDNHCTFPVDLDPGEPSFEGVRFSLYEDEIVISRAELYHWIKQAAQAYVSEHPEVREPVGQVMGRHSLSLADE